MIQKIKINNKFTQIPETMWRKSLNILLFLSYNFVLVKHIL